MCVLRTRNLLNLTAILSARGTSFVPRRCSQARPPGPCTVPRSQRNVTHPGRPGGYLPAAGRAGVWLGVPSRGSDHFLDLCLFHPVSLRVPAQGSDVPAQGPPGPPGLPTLGRS
jgi:hypothetical protein